MKTRVKDGKGKKYVVTQRVTLAGVPRKPKAANAGLSAKTASKTQGTFWNDNTGNIILPEKDNIKDSVLFERPEAANEITAPEKPKQRREDAAVPGKQDAFSQKAEVRKKRVPSVDNIISAETPETRERADYGSDPSGEDRDDEPAALKRRRPRGRESIPAWSLILLFAIIALLAAISLYLFVLRSGDTLASAPSPTLTETVALTPTPTPTPTPVPTPTLIPAPVTMWGANFPGKFTTGGIIKNDSSVSPTITALSPRFQECTIEVVGSYKSAYVNVTLNKVQEKGVTYYVSDIYVTDLKYFTSPFSSGKYNGSRKFTYQIARDNNAIVAINGDFYTQNPGPVLRDGMLYRNEVYCDMFVMFRDGTMKTYGKGEFDKNTIKELEGDVWQIWTFGPMLLKDGEPLTKFNLPKSNIGGANPRSAVGYYEPGHYCFVLVEARPPTGSKGLSMKDLSQLMYDLGCKVAFNLDGGGSAQLAFMGDEVNNKHISTYRKNRDVLCIVDEPAPEETAAPEAGD